PPRGRPGGQGDPAAPPPRAHRGGGPPRDAARPRDARPPPRDRHRRPWRDGDRVVVGPDRGAIEDLDTLASPHDYFDTHIVMTSRGCPWACTFCGAETTWGRGFRGNSVGYTLDALEKLTARLPVKMVQIKDDTFTTNKKRVMELCQGIRA